jgi:hypothetical protein
VRGLSRIFGGCRFRSLHVNDRLGRWSRAKTTAGLSRLRVADYTVFDSQAAWGRIGSGGLSMPTPYESAQLNLQLFELRREPVLREARDWFLRDFNPESFADLRRFSGW